tara:strand:+ start:318 stop:884 length:567 start_codon:yes stop_codon:yes gene_type:complete
VPKIVDHAKQRADLLEGAFELFADRGYAALSMRDLARGLGVTTGTLYHYFKSKDVIFEEMVLRAVARDLTAATAELSEELSASERLRLIFEWIQANEQDLRRVLLLVFDFQRHKGDDPLAKGLVSEASATYRREFELQVGAAPGIWPLILGGLIQGILEPSHEDGAARLQAMETLLLGTPTDKNTGVD